jgi:hypothetical protein
MSEQVKIAVITDGTPISPDVLGTGMCRINTQLFNSLSDNIKIIATTNLGGIYNINDIDKNLRSRCILIDLPKPIRTTSKVASRFSELFRSENIALNLKLSSLLSEFSNQSIDWLFCPCGVDPSALGRAIYLAQKTNLPLAVYLVDDFIDGAILSGNKRHLKIARKYFSKWLSQIDKIFVISEGFQQHLKENYKVDSVVLPLPYSSGAILRDSSLTQKDQVLYLGGLSHFYVDGLKHVAQAIHSINQESVRKISLRIASSANLSYVKSLLGDYDFIHCEPCKTLEDVRREVASSVICFAPYSFDSKYRTMVSTSFPSKIMDYLVAGKFILVYGPDYSSSASYFNCHHLPEVVTTENVDLLKQIILQQVLYPQDHSKSYINLLASHHSYEVISKQLLSNL